MRCAELARRRSLAAPGLNEHAILIEFRHPRGYRAIGYEDIPGGVPSHIGRAEEIVPGETSAAAPSLGVRRTNGIVDRLRFSAHGHHHAAFWIKFDDHVRAFIHYPDVVLRVDAHGVRLNKPIESLPDFADIFTILIELKKARG